MLDTIIGFKQKMGAVYVKDRRYPVTWVKVDPCIVTQLKNTEKDGYMSVQLGTGNKKEKRFTKPLLGHLKKVSTKDNKRPRFLREIRVKEDSGLKVGDEVKVTDVLKKGDFVTITGISKGKGFAGVVKRWGFAGGPKTHGQSDRERAPGSIGQRTTPGRVYKGKRMAGRMGSNRVTVKNMGIIDIDEKNNLVAITGPVPGIENGLVFIKKTGEGAATFETEESKEEIKVETVESTEEVKEAEGKDVVSESDTNSADGRPGEDKEAEDNTVTENKEVAVKEESK